MTNEPTCRGQIGIDISGKTIAMVQLSEPTRSARTWAVVPRSRADWADEASRIAGVLRRRGFEGNRVVLSATDSQLMWATVDLPPVGSGAPVDVLARAEAARVHRVDESKLVTCYWNLPGLSRQGEGSKWMTASFPADAARHLDAAFSHAGLEIVAIDAPMLAMARACRTSEVAERGLTPLLRISWDAALLVGVLDGEVAFARRLESPESKAVETTLNNAGVTDPMMQMELLCHDGQREIEPPLKEIATNLRTPLEQWGHELAQQVRQSMAYLAHVCPQADLLPMRIMGELSACQSLVQAAGTAAGAAFEAAPMPTSEAPQGSLTLAMGLALHESMTPEPATAGGAA